MNSLLDGRQKMTKIIKSLVSLDILHVMASVSNFLRPQENSENFLQRTKKKYVYNENLSYSYKLF